MRRSTVRCRSLASSRFWNGVAVDGERMMPANIALSARFKFPADLPKYTRAAISTQRRLIRRRLPEMRRALEIERRRAKDEIVERYLNQGYCRNGAYGGPMAWRG